MQVRIFIVEDNPFILEWLTQALYDLTLAQVVGSAATERQACDWLLTHHTGWDLAVVDIGLAQGNGVNVLMRLRSRRAGQRMVVLTNYTATHARNVCMAAGADAFFDKSTQIEEFAQYVNDGSFCI